MTKFQEYVPTTGFVPDMTGPDIPAPPATYERRVEGGKPYMVDEHGNWYPVVSGV